MQVGDRYYYENRPKDKPVSIIFQRGFCKISKMPAEAYGWMGIKMERNGQNISMPVEKMEKLLTVV